MGLKTFKLFIYPWHRTLSYNHFIMIIGSRQAHNHKKKQLNGDCFCATITTQMLAVESVVFKQLQIIYVNNRGKTEQSSLVS